MPNLIVKNNIKKFVKELDKDNRVGNIASDVSVELQKKVEDLLENGIKRAKANNRRTLFGRDL
ncbi:MAG: DUF1931 domain-containing protein [Nanoarchaeota archaeon]|nr:DUF1931 domain-containing protein [Nanoarchaeota archaeon]